MSTNKSISKTAVLFAVVSGASVGVNCFAQTAEQTSEKASQQCRTIRADEGWRSTGITVNPSQFVCVAADGLWSHGAQGVQGITPYYGPEGFAKDDPNNVPEVVSRVGALIGRIGQSAPFVVERGLCFIPTATGQLSLSMNDDPGAFGNNAGYLRVAVATWPANYPPDRVHLPSAQCHPR
jgi:hypothetical protein